MKTIKFPISKSSKNMEMYSFRSAGQDRGFERLLQDRLVVTAGVSDAVRVLATAKAAATRRPSYHAFGLRA